ncbi:phosphoenolpyruvate--protein phosphotransferase [Catenulispora sp. NF23]|uniref:Phosphoenolpyruvate-protein phosphotransferase n=1 Tax=Catenulispora pinistramenti TaxID=2705254 RepID=A0ABS5L7M6_9ACTN|nr:putative PEP-binding protein [Catenulispora pinistramenti]MBS2539517.1 phosphoenolpyruvate--protein phosphotransferase [Catenulispora pinistramenti]MBS2554373.1 phosphoenolpyruvate--protein phosphotransferase [Catenulispora pinistramenti]
MTRLTYVGQSASGGTALGVLRHTDVVPAALGQRGSGDVGGAGGPGDADGVGGPGAAGADPVAEVTDAFDAVAEQLAGLARTLRDSGQTDLADIVEVDGYIAQDQELRGAALRQVRAGEPASRAVVQAVQEYGTMLAALDDPMLAERAADVRQVGRRVLAHLAGAGTGAGAGAGAGAASAAPDGPVVLVAHEIGAADLLEYGDLVVAAVSLVGGPNSHASIIARSLGIPLVLGVSPAVLNHPDGTEVLIEAEGPSVVVDPEPGERQAAVAVMAAARRRREVLAAERDLPSQTLDGRAVALRANVATAIETKAANNANADGVGLLRTELPFLDTHKWPTADQHTAVLTPILSKLAGKPVTVRTLDFADDKFPPLLADKAVDGHLGRGLPYMLAAPQAFANQFRAILTAGAACDLRIMIPMVATVDELASCARILAEVATELGVPTPPIGAMIELPEAVEIASELAGQAGFFSIGSNDLTSQVLRLDRRDPAVSPALAAHPRVLQAIARTVTAAHERGLKVSVCGDAAAHPLVVPLLIGVGCDVLSVAPAALDEVRVRIRRLDARVCAEVAAEAMGFETLESVQRVVRQRCWPEMP